jgi:hypothetical protein
MFNPAVQNCSERVAGGGLNNTPPLLEWCCSDPRPFRRQNNQTQRGRATTRAGVVDGFAAAPQGREIALMVNGESVCHGSKD